MKLLRITTIYDSERILFKGQDNFLKSKGIELFTASSFDEKIKNSSNHFFLPLKRTVSPIRDLYAIFKTLLLIHKVNPDIVHTHTPKASMVGMIASFLKRTPIRIYSIGGLPLVKYKGLMYSILILVEKVNIYCATDVIVNSRGLLKYINENISVSPKLRVLGEGSTNGINMSFYKINQELFLKAAQFKKSNNLIDANFIWIFVGRLVGDKGVNELVMVFEELSNKYTNMKLLLVGSYEEALDPLQYLTKTIILKNRNIINVGFQDDVRPYLVCADCLVFPSHREGLPNVPMQAAAMNLPIITTDINGCNEVVEHGVNGLLIQPKSNESLKQAMLRIYEDSALRKKLSSNTREFIASKYNQEQVWENWIGVYEQRQV